MAAVRRAEVTWDGDLASGSGVTTASTSGAFSRLPVSWDSRTDSAAHASCFAMAFRLASAGRARPPRSWRSPPTVTFDNVDGGWKVVSSALTVRGEVSGMDQAGFAAAAEAAKDGCPISQALKGNVELSVDATLAN